VCGVCVCGVRVMCADATDMEQLVWDNGLSDMAAMVVSQCNDSLHIYTSNHNPMLHLSFTYNKIFSFGFNFDFIYNNNSNQMLDIKTQIQVFCCSFLCGCVVFFYICSNDVILR